MSDIEPHQVENALRESEQRYRMLFETNLDGILLTRPDGSVTNANPAACAILGLTEDEICRRGRDGLVDLNDPRLRPLLEERARTGSARGEVTLLRGDGARIECEIVSSLFVDVNGETRTSMCIRDVTAKWQAQELAAKNARFIAALADNLPGMVAYWNNDMRCAFANHAYFEWFGKKPHEILGLHMRDLLGEELYLQNEPYIRSALRGESQTFERLIPKPDGSVGCTWAQYIPDVSGGSVQGIYVLVTDISALKKTTEALEISEKRYRTIAETALRGEQKFRSMFEASPVPFALNDDHQNIRMVNQAFVKTFGYSLDDFSTLDVWWETAYPDPQYRREVIARWGLHIAQAREGSPGEPLELIVRCKDGQDKTVLAGAASLEDDSGKVTLVVLVDITARKQAEAELQVSKQQYESVVNALSEGIVIQDRTGLITATNPSAERILGFSPGQAIGRSSLDPMWRSVHADGTPFPGETHPAVVTLQTGEPHSNVIMGVHKPDDSVAWISINSRPLFSAGASVADSVVSSFTDITESHKIQLALEKEERFNRTVLDSLSANVAVLNQEGVIVAVNEPWRRFAAENGGQPLDGGFMHVNYLGVLRKAVEDGVPDAELMLNGIEHVLNDELPVYEAEYHCPSPTENAWFVIRVTRLTGHSGGVVVAHENVTEQHFLETELLKAQKLESLGIMAGGIAHDFNNLLAGIVINADIAKRELADNAKIQPVIADILATAEKAGELCEQLLAYSGRGKFVVQPVDLSKLAIDMSHVMRLSVAQKADLYYYCSDLPTVIEADATQIRQIMLNLVINAAEAITRDNQVIRISTGIRTCSRQYLAHAKLGELIEEGEYVFLEVSDAGHGMDSHTVERIFDPFFTTKFTGRGLGLAAVLGIVKGHHGAINVESKPDQGTTFTLLFPPANGEVPLAPKTVEAQIEAARTGTVLVVDDEAVPRLAAGRVLEHLGYSVLSATGGRHAVGIYRRFEADIAAVLLDLTMPGMDGEETLRELRTINPRVKVIITSGFNEQEAVSRFGETGPAGFLKKPYRIAQLAALLKNVLDQ